MQTLKNKKRENEELSSDEVDLALLSALGDAKEPLGAVALSFDLASVVRLSQASVGRKLKEYDMRGLTKRVGYKGRILTEKGQTVLKKLVDSAVIAQRNEEFLDALNSSEGVTLMEVLEARRALEREIAHLAALRATAADKKRLRALLREQYRALEQGETGTYENLAFHEALARMAKNQVLASALHLVRSQSRMVLMLDVIRTRVGGILASDHEAVVLAIEQKDPDAAAEAMSTHIDRIMEDVKKYLAIEEKERKG